MIVPLPVRYPSGRLNKMWLTCYMRPHKGMYLPSMSVSSFDFFKKRLVTKDILHEISVCCKPPYAADPAPDTVKPRKELRL